MINKNLNMLKKIAVIILLMIILIPIFVFAETNENEANVNKLITEIEDSFNNITKEEPLSLKVKIAEGKVKEAEAEIKKIKDIAIKETLQNSIKDLKDLIAALKAVDKSETPPLKMQNIASATKLIDKVNNKHLTIKEVLIIRLKDTEIKIIIDENISKATKAVEKAEKSMKDIDIALAKDTITLLLEGPVKEELNNRLDAVTKMLKLENLIIKYILYSTEENNKSLEISITEAVDAIDKLQNITLKSQYLSRIIVIEKIKLAVIAIEDFRNGNDIKLAEEAIFNISDKKAKSELEKKLKAIVTQIELDKNIKDARDSIEMADISIKSKDDIKQNQNYIKSAEEKVKKLPNSDIKKEFQDNLLELNKVLKTKELLVNLQIKGINKTLTAKEIETAEKAILNVKAEYKEILNEKLREVKEIFGTNESERIINDANKLIENASKTKLEKDISAAKKAINLIENIDIRTNLVEYIEGLELSIAEELVILVEQGTVKNSKTISADILKAKNAVDQINILNHNDAKTQLTIRIKAIESYILTIKELANAEKNISTLNVDTTTKMFNLFKNEVEKIKNEDKSIYILLTQDIETRLNSIREYLNNEMEKLEEAEIKVAALEEQLTPTMDPASASILQAQKAIDNVLDKGIKSSLQKRLDAIILVKDAKLSVARIEAYPSEKDVKNADALLSKIDNKYYDIIEDLGNRIAYVKAQMDIGKKIEEATNLVHKAISTRIEGDVIKAYFAVNSLKDLGESAKDSYERLEKVLKDLEFSIDNEGTEETNSKENAKKSIDKVIEIIDELNIYIANIEEGEKEEENKIKTAYENVELAKNQIIRANAEVKKLKDQKDLIGQINFANSEIELTEDNIDIKKSIMLINIASKSVSNAVTNEGRSKAKLDIAAARRAIDKIGHNNNKGIKLILSNNINAIETKLNSDSDEELINLAMDAVNFASNLLTKAVRENTVMDDQEEIDKAIFSAKIAIGWISDKNKNAKDTMNNFINSISQVFISEKEGIVNSERINNAEKAVQDAENKKGTAELEGYIRAARLKINIIKNDGPETDAKIKDLNSRLDILEGKNNGSSNNSSGTGGSSGNNGSTKPGNNDNKTNTGTSAGTVYPLSPLPNSERETVVKEPKWGKTKELKKIIPTINSY